MTNLTLAVHFDHTFASFSELRRKLEINIRPEYRSRCFDPFPIWEVNERLEEMGLVYQHDRDYWYIKADDKKLEEFEKLLDDIEAYVKAQFESFKENNKS